MMACANHPQVEARGTCASCGRPYCADCLVDLLGQGLCGPCRDVRLAGMQGSSLGPQRPETWSDRVIPTRNPPALTGYYLGIFGLAPCLGLALSPAALVLGLLGLRQVRLYPELPGRVHAIIAVVLGALGTLAHWGTLVFLMLGRAAGL